MIFIELLEPFFIGQRFRELYHRDKAAGEKTANTRTMLISAVTRMIFSTTGDNKNFIAIVSRIPGSIPLFAAMLSHLPPFYHCQLGKFLSYILTLIGKILYNLLK